MFFGKKLKELRLKHASMGLHNFAIKVKMPIRFYSEMERGLVPPPPCKKWIYGMMTHLNLEHDSLKAKELHNLWDEPFVMQKMDEDVVVSPFVHKTDGTRLTTEEYLNLNEHINSIGRKHNKIADEYNKERKSQKKEE